MMTMNDNFVGPERSLMVAAKLMKTLHNERRLAMSELRALERETQSRHVLQRKAELAKEIPEMEQEMLRAEKALRKMLMSPTDQLNPSGKYYVMAQKLVQV